jgi:hypothetical protein
VNITQAVIDEVGGLSVCGVTINNTLVNDDNSAIEAICVSPSGDIRLQLVRQLTAAALNCVISGGPANCSGTPIFTGTFSTCNTLCQNSGASTSSITACINSLDCLNNGGTLLSNGFCQTGSCEDGSECKQTETETARCADGSPCSPFAGNCHDEDLVNGDLGLDFEPPGAAGSSTQCNDAKKSACTVVGPGVSSCGQAGGESQKVTKKNRGKRR